MNLFSYFWPLLNAFTLFAILRAADAVFKLLISTKYYIVPITENMDILRQGNEPMPCVVSIKQKTLKIDSQERVTWHEVDDPLSVRVIFI